jgi:ribonuclease-3
MRMVRTSFTIHSSGKGGKDTDHVAIVQNQHLAVLAGVLGLEQYMLYGHGQDLCHDSELR